MVLVVIGHQGANLTLDRIDCDNGRRLKTHESIRPDACTEDIEHFRRSPKTCQRFGFWSDVDARVRGFSGERK